MSRRKRPGVTAPQPWEPFVEVPLSPDFAAKLRDNGWLPEHCRVFVNNRYQVIVRLCRCPEELPGTNMAHLSIKRHDRGALRDWRHLQRIKNELLGEDVEAVELYPAESRLVDDANQYHLWALDAGLRWPFGAPDRQVSTPEEAAAHGARQRPFA